MEAKNSVLGRTRTPGVRYPGQGPGRKCRIVPLVHRSLHTGPANIGNKVRRSSFTTGRIKLRSTIGQLLEPGYLSFIFGRLRALAWRASSNTVASYFNSWINAWDCGPRPTLRLLSEMMMLCSQTRNICLSTPGGRTMNLTVNRQRSKRLPSIWRHKLGKIT